MKRRLETVAVSLSEVLDLFHSGDVLVAGRGGSIRVGLAKPGQRAERVGHVLTLREAPREAAEMVVGLLDSEGVERGCLRVTLDGSWRLEIPGDGERSGIVLP